MKATQSKRDSDQNKDESSERLTPHLSNPPIPKRTDYVLVYTKGQNEALDISQRKNLTRKAYVYNLKAAGLNITQVTENENVMYMLVHTPFWKLLETAERLKLKLPIAVNTTETSGYFQKIWRCFHHEDADKNDEIRYFTAPYKSSLHSKFDPFFNKINLEETFSDKHRSMLTYEILNRTSYSSNRRQSQLSAVEMFEKINDSNSSSSNESFYVGIERLLGKGIFQAAYPLHQDYNENPSCSSVKHTARQALRNDWANFGKFMKPQPLNQICEYFGEKLGFYFAWLGFYTSSLILPAVFGVLVFLYGILSLSSDTPTNDICDQNGIGNRTMCPMCDKSQCQIWKLSEICLNSRLTYLIDNSSTLFFSMIMALWTVLFIDFWERKQARLQFEWGTFDFEKELEADRIDFERNVKKYKKNPITGENEPHVPLKEKIYKYSISFSAIFLMLCLVIIFIFSVIVYRMVLKAALSTKPNSVFIIGFTSAIINLLIIVLLSQFYSWLATRLTDMECHRTDSDYENSLTIKMYLFQFVNFYGSVFYIAFFKGKNMLGTIGGYNLQEQCDPSGCMFELFIQLSIIMVGKQIFGNVQEVLIPMIQIRLREFMNKRNASAAKNKSSNTDDNDQAGTTEHQWVKDYRLIPWDNLTLFDEYLEMIIQYGFMTLFIVGFPLGPLFSYLNNVFEIRIDAFKTLTQLRRPVAKKTKDIGIWLPIINVVSKLGILTNAFIIAFTSDFIPRTVYYFKYSKTMQGYVNFTLSAKNLTEFGFTNLTEEICYYRDFRESYNSPKKYEYSSDFYLVLSARFVFIVVFEHLVIFLVAVLHWLIPDVPDEIKFQIERQNFIKQRLVWEANEPLNIASTLNVGEDDDGCGDDELDDIRNGFYNLDDEV